MSITIYHNPRCSKSRKTLEIVNDAGVKPKVVLYLEDSPDAREILGLADKLGLRVADLVRDGETEFKNAEDLPDLQDNEALAEWIAAHPIVLQRPIVVDDETGRAIIGRPPDNVQALLS